MFPGQRKATCAILFKELGSDHDYSFWSITKCVHWILNQQLFSRCWPCSCAFCVAVMTVFVSM